MVVSLADMRPPPASSQGQVVRTPCLPSQRLSELLGCQITLKFETFQHCSSFKDRGAYVKLASLTEEERRARRDRHVGRQPRPGRRLPRDAGSAFRRPS